MGKIMFVFILLLLPCTDAEAEAASPRIDLSIIATIESGANPCAYNAREQAYGMYQIREGALADYNTAGPGRARPLVLSDMYDSLISEVVARWYFDVAIPRYLKYFKIKDTLENRIIAWNAGIGTLASGRPVPPITRAYIRVYKEMAGLV